MKYQTKPIVVEAVKFTSSTIDEVMALLPNLRDDNVFKRYSDEKIEVGRGDSYTIITKGQWVVKGSNGSITVMSEKKFRELHEKYKGKQIAKKR